ncbi:type IV pilus twitching motility protein PilT [bacterium]|nr:type IV pilus twitching motility protein PilT [bacterium]
MPSLSQLLKTAIAQNASDLHLSVGIPPSLRLNGHIAFLETAPLTHEDIEFIIKEVTTEAQWRKLQEKRELEFSYTHANFGRFRAAIFYERHNLSAAFRLVPFTVRTVQELHLPKIVLDIARLTHGLVLIVGATGQGKTTTMNSIIDRMNSERRVRIITVEDPIEFVHQHKRSIILQREVDDDTKSFNNALVAALRQDPNIICVGEMRDLETISTALTAAETGHLVLSTLHTQSSAQTINRIIDVFPSSQQNQVRLQLANTLQAVLCQRLLPNATGDGRVLAFEILLATQAVRHMIREGRIEQIHNAMLTGRNEGMMPLDYCLRALYEEGKISYDTAVSNALFPNAFESIRNASVDLDLL